MSTPAYDTLVCDTSILLYLGRIQHLHLLPQLYRSVLVPRPVVFELDVDAKRASLIPSAGDLLVALRQTGFRLDQQLLATALELAGE